MADPSQHSSTAQVAHGVEESALLAEYAETISGLACSALELGFTLAYTCAEQTGCQPGALVPGKWPWRPGPEEASKAPACFPSRKECARWRLRPEKRHAAREL